MHNLIEVLSSIDDAIWAFDLSKNRFSYVNQRLADIYEIPLGEITEKPSIWLEFVHPDDYHYVLAESAWPSKAKQVELEYRLCINNQIKWVSDKRVVKTDTKNVPVAITGVLADITAKKNAELKLSESEITFRYLFINNPNPLWIYDLNTLEFLDVNHAAIAKYGFSKEEFLAMKISDIRPKEDLPLLMTELKQSRAGFRHADKQCKHRKKNKEIMYVNLSGHRLKYQGKDAEIVMVHDVTNQEHSKQAILLAKENLDALINNLDDSIWSIDAGYRIMSANISFKIRAANLIKREVRSGECIFFPELKGVGLEVWKNHYDRALKGEAFHVIEMISDSGTTPHFAETKFSPIVVDENIIGVACISRSIQERLESQRRLIEQNSKLLELISIASHEIRGPLMSIMGLTNVFNSNDYSDPFNAEVIHLIQSLTMQLDKMMYTLVDKTYALQQDNQLKYSSLQNLSTSE